MSFKIGSRLELSLFGESHGAAIGAVCCGFPAGEKIDFDALKHFVSLRSPGKAYSSKRVEADEFEILSGLNGDVTTGAPLCAVISNTDARPQDYKTDSFIPRPGHADFTAHIKWNGFADLTGGGHFSGRLTAPLCVMGGIALQMLKRRDVRVFAHVLMAGNIWDDRLPLIPDDDLLNVLDCPLPVINQDAKKAMLNAVKSIKDSSDSVGGIAECAVTGLEAGLGGYETQGVESRLARALFAIPAVKGVEFGSGFDGARLLGSQNDDEFFISDGSIKTRTNNCGGILGGITTGMPVTMCVAFKPTPTIGLPLNSVDILNKCAAVSQVSGRHDPCIVPRGVHAVKAVAALCALDLLLEGI